MTLDELLKLIREKSGKENVPLEEAIDILNNAKIPVSEFINLLYCARLIDEIEKDNVSSIFSIILLKNKENNEEDAFSFSYIKELTEELKMCVYLESSLVGLMNRIRMKIKDKSKLEVLNFFNKEFLGLSNNVVKNRIIEMLGIENMMDLNKSESKH